MQMADRVRVAVHGVLSSENGDQYRPVKVLREVLGTANDLVGRPFCSAEELESRRARGAKFVAATQQKREPAPVMLYFDGKDHRSKAKLEELLRSRDVPFKVLDCTDDEATRSWAIAAAKQPEFPLLFIAGEAVGGLHEVTQLDVNGGLKRRVFG
jgi:glutaredoxin-related protein